MENNFDKIFKDKLEHRKFEMKPEYWAGAEALIEADEKNDDWRRFILWFGVVLVAGLGVFFIWKKDNSNTIVEAEKTSNTTFGNVIAPASEMDKNEIEISKEKIFTDKNENINSINETASTLSENQKSKINSADLKNTKQLNDNSDVFSKTIPSTKQSVNNLEDNNNSDGLKNNNNTPTLILNDKSQSNQSGGNAGIIAEQKGSEEKLIPTIQEETSTGGTENLKREEETIAQPIASTPTILLPFLEMFLANNKKVEKLALEAVCPFTPPRNKFTFGGFIGAVGYPVENSSQSTFIGGKAGFLVERNFEIGKANMALGAEVAYHYRRGNFVATKQNEVASYSFGRSVAQAKLTPENLHYLELPFYLKYQRKRMSFETGASFNYLLGVRGKVTGVDQTVESGWVPSLGFKKNHVNVLLGFHYRFSDNLHFGIRANYTPGGILDKNAILPDGVTVALQESKPLYLTFRVTQYLKLKR